MPEGKPILALNCGSSSLKFSLYQVDDDGGASLIFDGNAEEIGLPESALTLGVGSEPRKEEVRIANHAEALTIALQAMEKAGTPEPVAIGHRLVDGGKKVRAHQILTPEVMRELEEAVPLAPLHMPASLAVLKAAHERFQRDPQVVCLDTAFHSNIPDVAKTIPLPARWRDVGIERFGFHGLSLESVVAQMDAAPPRMVVAHLGNGASITAIRDGASIDTSMAFTPNAGVMMGTRCGDLDPGVAIYLMRHEHLGVEELDKVLEMQSGLLGVSGVSSDVRELVSVRAKNKDADLALRMFCYQVRKTIAAMAAALGGVDAIVFTGGIGEHATDLRNDICEGLRFLGPVRFMVVRADENWQIARTTARLAGV